LGYYDTCCVVTNQIPGILTKKKTIQDLIRKGALEREGKVVYEGGPFLSASLREKPD